MTAHSLQPSKGSIQQPGYFPRQHVSLMSELIMFEEPICLHVMHSCSQLHRNTGDNGQAAAP